MFGKIVTGIVFLLLPLFANAQGSPAPMGSWATKPPSEHLFVSASGCKFTATNGQTTMVQEGQCSWNPSSAGGILTIINIHFYKPAPIYYNIIWVNPKQIKMDGDLFYKQD